MPSLKIEIPEELIASAKMPKKNITQELKKELALHLYSIGILSFGNARKLSGLSKVDFHLLLGQRQVSRHYSVRDYERDITNLKKWERKG